MINHDFPYLDTRDLNLDWLLKNMKEILANWVTYQESMNHSFETLQEAFDQLEHDVYFYLDNLDLYTEIRRVMMEWLADGRFAEAVTPIITDKTDAWLTEHITNPSSPPLDSSLSLANAAAQAKATGDKLNAIISDIGDITGNTIYTATATGAYIDIHSTTTDITTPTSSASAEYLLMECSPGDVFTVNTVGGTSALAYGFVAADGETIISKSGPSHTSNNEVITAPANSAYLVVNAVSNNHITVYQGKRIGTEVNGLIAEIAKAFLLDAQDNNITALSNGTDLNSLTTPGNYKATTNAAAASMDNCPVSQMFALKVLDTGTHGYIAQILIPYSPSSGKIWYRLGATADWREIADRRNVIEHTTTIITGSNYLTYFPNGSFNDAPPNTLYYIRENVANLLSDGPAGDRVTGLPTNQADPSSPAQDWGQRRGTLLTYSQAQGEAVRDGLTQIFIAYPGYQGYYGAVSPTISFRTSYLSSGSYVWSRWSKLGEAGVLHAGNAVVYGGQPYITDAPFTDLNDAPWNSIYHIDRNMDGSDSDHTLQHHPIPGQSCMVITYAFSYGFNHCRVQVVYALNGKMFWRYEYLDNGEHWTTWYEMVSDKNEYFRNRGVLANGSDLNNILVNCVYYLSPQASGQYDHSPITSGAGYLTVKHNGTITLQVVEALAGTRYSRYSSDDETWSNWV